MLFFFFVWNAVYRQVLLSLPQLVEKVCFFKKVLVLNPYPQTPFPRKGAILLGLPPLVQERMLAVSHTKPLHDAVAQMADDLYGGYAPATPFLSTIEVFR